MQPMHQPQYTRRRGPKLSIPLDADVASVRYYKCPVDKPIPPAKGPNPARNRPVPKIHLRFIPPSMRRPSPWSEFLTDWLNSCEEKRAAAAAAAASSHDGDVASNYGDDSCSSSSGACSGDTVTTDFSSVSSPRKAPPPENRLDRTIRASPSVQLLQPRPRCYPYRVPRGSAHAAQLTTGQWAELLQLQQAAIRPKQHHPPPKLLNIHTAYLPGLDAAVMAMMQPSQQQQSSYAPRQSWQQPQQRGHYFKPADRSSQQGVVPGSSGCSTGSEEKDSSQVCSFCYQHAVHDADARGTHLPRLTDRGCWRGHVLRQDGGRTIVCPRLLRRVCSLCGATGQSAHQTNYCPTTNRRTVNY